MHYWTIDSDRVQDRIRAEAGFDAGELAERHEEFDKLLNASAKDVCHLVSVFTMIALGVLAIVMLSHARDCMRFEFYSSSAVMLIAIFVIAPLITRILTEARVMRRWIRSLRHELDHDEVGSKRELLERLREYDPRIDYLFFAVDGSPRLTSARWSRPWFALPPVEWTSDWRLFLRWYVFRVRTSLAFFIAATCAERLELSVLPVVLGAFGALCLGGELYRLAFSGMDPGIPKGLLLATWSVELAVQRGTGIIEPRLGRSLYLALSKRQEAGIRYWLRQFLQQLLQSVDEFRRRETIDRDVKPYLELWIGRKLPVVAEEILDEWSEV